MHLQSDPLAIARRVVTTPRLALEAPFATESAWGQLKAASGLPISTNRALRMIPNHDIRKAGTVELVERDVAPATACAVAMAQPGRIGVAGQLARRMRGLPATEGGAA